MRDLTIVQCDFAIKFYDLTIDQCDSAIKFYDSGIGQWNFTNDPA